MAKPDQTVVFDFDYTLTSWDSADRFFRWLLKRAPYRMGLVIVLLPVLAPLLLSKKTRKFPIRYAVWVATFGQSQESIESLARLHVQEIVANGQSLLLKDGSDKLRWHHEQGHSVVIATGSLEVLAREFLLQSGLGHIPLVGSSLKPFLFGMASKEHCFGDRKIPMLSERGFPPPWAVTYTDHECDLPVLELSKECFLINPKPRAIQLVTEKLSCRPKILAWQ